ncbi:MAG: DoxX family protein [Pirellulales bacterium]|nr:DoxX family protein [Pirellulales bacterium]
MSRRAKEVPLSNRQFQIGALAVVALVALRLGLGCHFLYEGAWKIKNYDTFTSEPFLTQAKGPLAGLFYAMVPDIHGRRQLRLETDADGDPVIYNEITARWDGIRDDFLEYYRPDDPNDEGAAAKHEKLARGAEHNYKLLCNRLKKYLELNAEKIEAYFEALDRHENDKERLHGAPFQKERRWNQMMLLRQEAAGWIKDIENQERAWKNTLYGLLDDEQKKIGAPPEVGWNPFTWSRMQLIDFTVTASLTAIGICLMLGLCTPLAALGGAGFMCFVVMTQPAFPGIYPPDSAVVGHALLVNKDFIEMLALLAVAFTSAGRWGGLDFFFHQWYAARRRRKELNRLSKKYQKEKQSPPPPGEG